MTALGDFGRIGWDEVGSAKAASLMLPIFLLMKMSPRTTGDA